MNNLAEEKNDDMKRITIGQVKVIAKEISKRWQFVNHGSYYNCIDKKTGQESNHGGDYNFASYWFKNKVEDMYLHMIAEDTRYTRSCTEKDKRQRWLYLYKIQKEVVRLLCGFTGEEQIKKHSY